jgi:hypothetical protein
MIVRKTWDFETPIWCKLQIDIDADSDKIIAFDLTDKLTTPLTSGHRWNKRKLRQLRSWLMEPMTEAMFSTLLSPRIRPSDSSFLRAREACSDQLQGQLRANGTCTFVRSNNMGA